MSKQRNYLFTLNNYSENEIELLKKIECKYLIWGYEIGEKCGTPHLQGFVSFINPRTINGLKREKAWKRAHVEVALKPLSAIDYCKKGSQSHDEWTEFGIKGPNYGKDYSGFEIGEFKQGARNDLAAAYEAIKDGESVADLTWRDPSSYTFASKTLEKLEDLRLQKRRRDFMTEGIWIFGKTGLGKSAYAEKECEGHSWYCFGYDGDWWDNYAQQDMVIIDDFRGQITYSQLLRLVDRTPFAEVRRRCRPPMPFVSKKVIITSSLPPWKVFHNLDALDNLNQLYRRFQIFELDENGLNLIDPHDYASS